MNRQNILSYEQFIGQVGNRPYEFWEIIDENYNCDSETDIENRQLTKTGRIV